MGNGVEGLADNKANKFQGKAWQMYADVMKAIAGPALDWAALLRGGTMQLNRIGRTNDAGEYAPTPILITAAGSWDFSDTTFSIFAPSDRLRIILNMKFYLAMTDAEGVVDGATPVPDQIRQLLDTYGLLEVNRQRGNAVRSKIGQFLSGAPTMRPTFTDADVANFWAQETTPSEIRICPWGFGQHLLTALDGLNKQERTQFTVRGAPELVGAIANLPADTGVALIPEAIVWDGVLSGQGS